ncbi:MAG: toll/interleukin-1 receptor domain-containing protein [Dehalococcoidia bacterium]|nr:toll/interleukin-1 receptor domain-containing protein [Dehalococcoidia bacterium]
MSHDIFISYAKKDAGIAREVHEYLEQNGIECFIDAELIPGVGYHTQLAKALKESRLLVLIFSHNADVAEGVGQEVAMARTKSIPIIPFRTEDIMPEELAFFLSTPQWLDGFPPPIAKHLPVLLSAVGYHLAGEQAGVGKPQFAEDQTNGEAIGSSKTQVVKDHEWHDVDYKDLSGWVKERIRDFNAGKQLKGRTFVYRKNRFTDKYQRKLKNK